MSHNKIKTRNFYYYYPKDFTKKGEPKTRVTPTVNSS